MNVHPGESMSVMLPSNDLVNGIQDREKKYSNKFP